MTVTNLVRRVLDLVSRTLTTVYRIIAQIVRRFVRTVFVDSNKPPERFKRWPSTPGPAFDVILCGLLVLFGIAYLLT